MKTIHNQTKDFKNSPEVTIAATVTSQIDKAFNYIAPINVMHIFRGNATIPAVVDTSIKEGWNKAGLQRTVYFKDGSSAKESLLTVNGPTSFSYKSEQFTGKALKVLVKRFEGEWLFTELENHKTKIEWTYRVVPTNFFARIMIKLVLVKPLRSALQEAMDIIKKILRVDSLKKEPPGNNKLRTVI